jgi:hypothetical protein
VLDKIIDLGIISTKFSRACLVPRIRRVLTDNVVDIVGFTVMDIDGGVIGTGTECDTDSSVNNDVNDKLLGDDMLGVLLMCRMNDEWNALTNSQSV